MFIIKETPLEASFYGFYKDEHRKFCAIMVVTCWERADLLALVCGVYCEFVTFPLVSWVRLGT